MSGRPTNGGIVAWRWRGGPGRGQQPRPAGPGDGGTRQAGDRRHGPSGPSRTPVVPGRAVAGRAGTGDARSAGGAAPPQSLRAAPGSCRTGSSGPAGAGTGSCPAQPGRRPRHRPPRRRAIPPFVGRPLTPSEGSLAMAAATRGTGRAAPPSRSPRTSSRPASPPATSRASPLQRENQQSARRKRKEGRKEGRDSSCSTVSPPWLPPRRGAWPGWACRNPTTHALRQPAATPRTNDP